MRVFVTVGSTQFDALVDSVLSQPVLQSLRARGYSKVVVQCGKYGHDLGETNEPGCWRREQDGVELEIWRYKSSLESEYAVADLVISHGGSGTILDVLRLGKPLIVVPNPTLLDNHQAELASQLNKLGHLRLSTIYELFHCIAAISSSNIQPFPPKDSTRFRNFLDEEMGFSQP